MRRLVDRLGWGIAGALAVVTVLAIAGAASGGPIDPTGGPGSTDSVRLPGTPVEGPTTISTSGHYYLTRDISVTGAANAIVVNASNVSLDLGGFTIDGDDTPGSHGILAQSSALNFALSNGTVTDFHVGVKLIGSNPRVDDVHVISNIRGMEVQSFTATITDCSAKSNTEAGIYLLGERTLITRCHAASNNGPGFALGGNENMLDGSTALLNNLSQEPTWKSVILVGNNHTVRDTVVNGIRVDGDFNDIYDTDCWGAGIEVVAGSTNLNTSYPDHLNINC